MEIGDIIKRKSNGDKFRIVDFTQAGGDIYQTGNNHLVTIEQINGGRRYSYSKNYIKINFEIN